MKNILIAIIFVNVFFACSKEKLGNEGKNNAPDTIINQKASTELNHSFEQEFNNPDTLYAEKGINKRQSTKKKIPHELQNFQITEQANFWTTYKDIINLVSGLIIGVFLSILSLLFTYRFNWRNRITNEFRVKLISDFQEYRRDKLTKIFFNYEINCTHSDEVSINYIYIKMPKKFIGNLGPNPTLSEMFEPNKGKYYIKSKSEIIKHFKSDSMEIDDESFLKCVHENKIKSFRLIVNCSRYGNVTSNKINIRLRGLSNDFFRFYKNLFSIK